MSLAWALVESNPLNMLSQEQSQQILRRMRSRKFNPGERVELAVAGKLPERFNLAGLVEAAAALND